MLVMLLLSPEVITTDMVSFVYFWVMRKLYFLLLIGIIGFESCQKCGRCRVVNAALTDGRFVGADAGDTTICGANWPDGVLVGTGILTINGSNIAVSKHWQCGSL